MKINLNEIAAHLESLEETIIFKLITRAQYKQNLVIYKKGESGFKDQPQRSLFGVRLLYQEQLEAKFCRYEAPEEKPFNKDLPAVERDFKMPKNLFKKELIDQINLTDEILNSYLNLIKNLCEKGDDSQYGSSVEHDVQALQAISERVHFGSFYVAEAKYQENPAVYQKLIEEQNEKEIFAQLTRQEVEENILKRIREKTFLFQQALNSKTRYFVDPALVMNFYKDVIIPLTKKGEVLYLLGRK